MRATRDGFGEAIVELAEKDKRIVALTADLTPSVKLENFEKKFPNRFFQCGVAEANMIGMAAGLALEGKIPFASTFGVFMPNRCLDHIRQSVCYNNVNVKLVATHCGLITGPDGATHQALEDVAIMRALPNTIVLVPGDFTEAKKAVKAAAKVKGPVYIRLTRPKTEDFSKGDFKIGKGTVLRQGKDVSVIGCGPVLYQAILAAEKLKGKVDVEIVNMASIKPIDTNLIVKTAKKTGKVITIEDHQINGGLGSAVAEVLGENYPVKMIRLGVRNSFGESGSPDELLKKHGLDAESMVKRILSLV
ncbi:transketolase family protein [Candidatus Woesearchaeota archaeon]|nr:transketolase family protein [Candidatus Woesearchaeota archaeon]